MKHSQLFLKNGATAEYQENKKLGERTGSTVGGWSGAFDRLFVNPFFPCENAYKHKAHKNTKVKQGQRNNIFKNRS